MLHEISGHAQSDRFGAAFAFGRLSEGCQGRYKVLEYRVSIRIEETTAFFVALWANIFLVLDAAACSARF